MGPGDEPSCGFLHDFGLVVVKNQKRPVVPGSCGRVAGGKELCRDQHRKTAEPGSLEDAAAGDGCHGHESSHHLSGTSSIHRARPEFGIRASGRSTSATVGCRR